MLAFSKNSDFFFWTFLVTLKENEKKCQTCKQLRSHWELTTQFNEPLQRQNWTKNCVKSLFCIIWFIFTTCEFHREASKILNWEKNSKMGRVYLENFGGARIFSCLKCETFLTNRGELLSTRFTGATGRAFLFNKVVNLKYGYVQLWPEYWDTRIPYKFYYTFRVRYLNGWTIPRNMDELLFLQWECICRFRIEYSISWLW